MEARQQQDIAEPAKPSITALSVANGFRLGLEDGMGAWFEDDALPLTTRLIQMAMQKERKAWVRGVEKGIYYLLPNRVQSRLFSMLGLHGYHTYITMRKLLIREQIHAAIKERDVEQVVILAGGFDLRALLSARQFPHVDFFELDRGETREIKMQALQEILPAHTDIKTQANGSTRINTNLLYIDCDLAQQRLQDVLEVNGFKRDRVTMIVAEGLTMYLPNEAMHQLMHSFADVLTEDGEVLLSFSTQLTDQSRVAAASRSINQEDYRFCLPVEDVCEYVNGRGFAVCAKANHVKMFKQAGDTANAEYYAEHSDFHKEVYYRLQKDPRVLESAQDMTQVPDFEYTSAARSASEPGCNIL